MDEIEPRHLAQDVEVAQHEGVFRDDADRLPRLEGHFEAAPRQAKAPLGRLVAISDSRHGHELALPAITCQKFAKQLGRAFLNKNLRLEIDSCVESQIL